MKPTGVALCAVVLCTVLLPVAAAHADSLTDYLGPREIGVGEAMRADARGALATTLNPAGVALSSELVFEGSLGYRTGDGAMPIAITGCDSTVPVAGCYYYRYFTASPAVGGVAASRRVHEGGATLARAIAGKIYAGVGIKYFDYDSDLPGEGESSGFSVDVGLVARPVELVSLAVTGYNLAGADSPQYPRGVGGGLLLRPLGALGLSFDALWKLDTQEGETTGRYGGGLEYFFYSAERESGFPVRAGVVHDVGSAQSGTYLTAGLGLMSYKVALDLGTRVQVSGGDELVILASLRFFGPRQVPGTARFR